MFRKDVQQLRDLILRNLRAQGLETPLLQKRLIDSWPEVAGELVANYTQGIFIKNQTLFVHLTDQLNNLIDCHIVFICWHFGNFLEVETDTDSMYLRK